MLTPLMLAVLAAPPPSTALLDAWLGVTAQARCSTGDADAGVTLLALNFDSSAGGLTWKTQRFVRCSPTPGNVLQSAARAAHALGQKTPPSEGAPATFVEFDDTAAAFSKRFGFKQPRLEANAFNRYTPAEVERFFKALYVAPETPLAGTTAQEVYAVLFKATATRAVEHLVYFEQHLPAAERAQVLAVYVAEVKRTSKGFDGNGYLRDVISKRFPEMPNAWASERVLGVMMRRQHDGTWPTVRKLAVKALTAYDAPLAAQLKAP